MLSCDEDEFRLSLSDNYNELKKIIKENKMIESFYKNEYSSKPKSEIRNINFEDNPQSGGKKKSKKPLAL